MEGGSIFVLALEKRAITTRVRNGERNTMWKVPNSGRERFPPRRGWQHMNPLEGGKLTLTYPVYNEE
jgi:hypothetical protein